jgi:hypothetical protein
MKKSTVCLLALWIPSLVLGGDLKGKWVLKGSEITYEVTHPLHEVKGKSTAAKGKGECKDGKCQFLVAVPVKSFDSGDGDRDLHMLQVTRGADNPLIVVNAAFTLETRGMPARISVDADVQFAGKKHTYPGVKLTVEDRGAEGLHITGTIPLSLEDFEIQPPALLGVPIRDSVPVKLDMVWKKATP